MRRLAKAYYNRETGFTAAGLAKKAGVKDEEARAFLRDQEALQVKRRRTGNFVAPYPQYQLQVDLADFSDFTPTSRFRYALVATDIFTKEIAAVPLKSKETTDTATALEEVLQQLGYPTYIATDQGGEFKGAFLRKMRLYDIQPITLRSYAQFVERAIYSIKQKIAVRQRVYKKPWTSFIDEVVKQLNSTKKVATGMTPAEANEHPEVAHENMMQNARIRSYEPVEKGDRVRTLLKRKPGVTSEVWGTIREVDEVEYGTLKRYRVGQQWYLRHELLKIHDAQRPFTGRLAGQGVISRSMSSPRREARG